MLDGWYCRSIANQQSSGAEANEQDDDLEDAANNGAAGAGGNGGGAGGDSGSEDESQAVTMSHNAINQRVDYRAQYSGLKKKLKFLLYVSWVGKRDQMDIICMFSKFSRKMNSSKMHCDPVNVAS